MRIEDGERGRKEWRVREGEYFRVEIECLFGR